MVVLVCILLIIGITQALPTNPFKLLICNFALMVISNFQKILIKHNFSFLTNIHLKIFK